MHFFTLRVSVRSLACFQCSSLRGQRWSWPALNWALGREVERGRWMGRCRQSKKSQIGFPSIWTALWWAPTRGQISPRLWFRWTPHFPECKMFPVHRSRFPHQRCLCFRGGAEFKKIGIFCFFWKKLAIQINFNFFAALLPPGGCCSWTQRKPDS